MTEHSDDRMDRRPDGFESLQLEAPPDTLKRFRRRASLLQGTRYVLERQFYGFWIVLNTLLKLLFKQSNIPVAAPDPAAARRYRRAIQNSKEERP